MSKTPTVGALFPLGQVVATPCALEVLTQADITNAIRRHLSGDWGDLDDHDKKQNTNALKEHSRILSAYTTGSGVRFWIITEAYRSSTTILLPNEY